MNASCVRGTILQPLASSSGFRKLVVWGVGALMATSPTMDSRIEAQQLSVEARGGLTMPYGDLSKNSHAAQGFGASGALHLGITPKLGVYAGGSYHTFVCNPVQCGGDLNSRGGEAGVRYAFPGTGIITPWVRGGLMVHRAYWSAPVSRVGVEETPVDPTLVSFLESEWDRGFELGGGLDFQIRDATAFTLGARHHRYSTQFPRSELPPLDRTFSYFLVDVGFRHTLLAR